MSVETVQRGKLNALRRLVDILRFDPHPTGKLFAEAMERFLTAVGYDDLPLMRSAREEAKLALEALYTESIEDQVKRSSQALGFIRWISGELQEAPLQHDEEFDELGRSVSQIVTHTLQALRDRREEPIEMVQKHGFDVPNLARLDEHIARWEEIKADLVDRWPWSTGPIPLPPADREMIARSRAALQAGERGESLEAVIARRRSR